MEEKNVKKNKKLKLPKEEYEVYYGNGKKMSKNLIERMHSESLCVYEVKEPKEK